MNDGVPELRSNSDENQFLAKIEENENHRTWKGEGADPVLSAILPFSKLPRRIPERKSFHDRGLGVIISMGY